MPSISYAGASYQAAPGETVLDTLLRHGVPVSSSCRAGACQSCLLRASEGAVPHTAQRGLKSTLIAQGYFLSCALVPDGDLAIEPAAGLEVPVSIASLERLTPTVLRVRLRVNEPLAYRAGQYVTLRRRDGLSRSYSLASLPHEDTVELHVRLAPHGRMSGWLFNDAREGETLFVRGPAGDCFYAPGTPDQPLLLAGTGTGLAPLAGICRDALLHGHVAPIHLFHGSRTSDGFYLQQEIASWRTNHANVHYHPVIADGADVNTAAALIDAIAAAHPALTGWRGFACGNPSAVAALTRSLFLSGISSREIFSDAFVEAPRDRAVTDVPE